MSDILNEAANGKRIPDWMLPDLDPNTRRRLRPDILRIKGLPINATPAEIERAFRDKALTLQIIEVGYGPDTRWREVLERKKAQHAHLKQLLSDAGWTVEEHIIILGRAGTMLRHALTTLQALDLSEQQAVKLMGKLHLHAVHKLCEIVIARRQMERSKRGSGPGPPPSGVG